MVLDCALHERDGKRWCSPPSRPMLDRDRRLVVGDDGKVKYVPTIDFVDTKTRSRWSTAAVQAIDAWLADDSKAPAEAGAMSGGTSDGGEPPGVRSNSTLSPSYDAEAAAERAAITAEGASAEERAIAFSWGRHQSDAYPQQRTADVPRSRIAVGAFRLHSLCRHCASVRAPVITSALAGTRHRCRTTRGRNAQETRCEARAICTRRRVECVRRRPPANMGSMSCPTERRR